ncbi:hypothetical protein JCM19274_3841 [Algibacter lectus]|uniref:Uncharacterized protein n=1 Tax=Algibacter lectus TaxID=221126 RepID=A0A090X1K9_9FLAO|nr:hypothetical protein [Algibacter lectus]GAL82703.1 hypothetical protein JCM19274_3841 [Algibacter lectus]
MKYPDEVDLMSFFECEPTSLDSNNIPFFYNESTYNYTNEENQNFNFKLTPSYGEVSILVKNKKMELSNIKLKSVYSLSILSDKKEEKRIMITSENFIVKISFKPEFQFEIIEEKDV